MKNSRRSFIRNGFGSALATAVLPAVRISNNNEVAVQPKPRIKLSISSYSYWHFKGEKFPVEKVIDEAAKLGVEGIDILHRQMNGTDTKYINELKRRAYNNGIAFTCLSIHQGFVTPDKKEWE